MTTVSNEPLEWENGSARSAIGDLYEVASLGGSVWQVRWNGTAFTGWYSSQSEARAAAEDHYKQALRNQSPEPSSSVRVKGLEWESSGSVPDGPWSEKYLKQSRGHHNLGRYAGSYTVQEMEPAGKWGWWNTWTSDREPEGVENTEAEAKAAADADFASRIRSVLEPTVSQPVTGEEVEWKTEASGLEVATIQHDDFSLLEVCKSRSPRHAFHLTIHRGSEDKGAWDDLSIDLTEGEALKLAAAVSDYQALKAERDEALDRHASAVMGEIEATERAASAEARLSAVEGALADAEKALTGVRDNLVRLGWEENTVMVEGLDKAISAAREALTAQALRHHSAGVESKTTAEDISTLNDTDLLLVAANRIKTIAFDIPAPNVHTPRLVQLAIALEQECYRRQAAKVTGEVGELIAWLEDRAQPDSGLDYGDDSRGIAYATVHGYDAAFVAEHFHGKGAAHLASLLRAALAAKETSNG